MLVVQVLAVVAFRPPLPASTARHSAVRMYEMPDASKYGRDPRLGLASDQFVADADWSQTPGAVQRLVTINQLEAALEAADAEKQVVALKFVREGCKACAATSDLFAQTANEYGSAAQFYEVDFDEARKLVKACEIKAVPCGQLYSRGKMQRAMATGPKRWDDFRAGLEELRSDLDGTASASAAAVSPAARWGPKRR